MTTINVGEFELKSTKLLATDPCYDKGTWCATVIENALPGKWSASIITSDEGMWGERVAELEVHNLEDLQACSWIRTFGAIGVDSGQAGFFDFDKYPEGDLIDRPDGEAFYEEACAASWNRVTNQPAGIVGGYGVNSSSGLGDGGYPLYVARNLEGQVVGAKIVFISDELNEDDDSD